MERELKKNLKKYSEIFREAQERFDKIGDTTMCATCQV